MYKQVGTCSICGGSVVLFNGPWMGVEPPKPYCTGCNATPKTNLPVIEMQRESSTKLLHS